MKKIYDIFVDGSSLGNPGAAGGGFIIKNTQGEVLIEKSIPFGIKTNNEAGYMALIEALQYAQNNGIRRIRIFTDSELMYRQLGGKYKVKAPNLKLLYNYTLTLLKRFEKWDIIHIHRNLNKDADRLAKQAAMEVKK
ncbi:MAG TPA: ribonuclease HI family protein [candidate division WOR-3 bacterium]|uniref:Ribonuclease HI family protein n=1 Tax=candidate division WOR-3 bacterium TaxID=2052148 RepID=A0A7V0Q6D9_UNCW3|nr:ribonuclease HI family protein [candidate division WOR-3 bacterium]